MSTGYYGLKGEPISVQAFYDLQKLKCDRPGAATPDGPSSPEEDPTRIGGDHVGEAWVSTVWLGMDHQNGDGPPLIFETMIFFLGDERAPSIGAPAHEIGWRYSSPEQARAGHERVVQALQEGREP